MKKLSCLIVLFALQAVALAAGQTANVSWVMPTTYSDNSALPLTDIASTTISWAPVSPQAGPSGTQTVTGTATTATVPVACGSVTFTVAVTTASTAKYPNATSGPSNAVPYATGIKCVPNPATGLTVN